MIKTQIVDYREGKTTLEGFVAYDDASTAKRPGVMVVPEWYGVNALTHQIGERIAALGYVAFGVDVYGKGIRPVGVPEAQKISEPYYQDRALLRRRGTAALAALREQPFVNQSRIGGIGYCFGGITLLEMARGGTDFAGLVAFHTQVATPMPAPATPGAIKPKVLLLHGADDPLVPQSDLDAFMAEMRGAKADWQIVAYGNAVHSFTNPDWPSDPTGTKVTAYHEQTDKRSWSAMTDFLREIFA
jgi:dienelactone hydrolase